MKTKLQAGEQSRQQAHFKSQICAAAVLGNAGVQQQYLRPQRQIFGERAPVGQPKALLPENILPEMMHGKPKRPRSSRQGNSSRNGLQIAQQEPLLGKSRSGKGFNIC